MIRPTRGTTLSAVAALVVSTAVIFAAPNPVVAAPAATPAPAGSRQVTLVTGDVVTVATNSSGRVQTSIAKHARTGPGAQFETFTLGAHVYVVPVSATPYLNSTLDLSLFDVAHPSPNLHLTFRSASAPSSVPGLRITHRSGTAADATVTRSTAFSAALARQWVADHRSSTHTTGLFANLARVAPAVSLPSTPQPNYPMYTLTVHGIDQSGHADTGDTALIYNVDDLRRYGGFPTFFNGIAKVSVPAGHYAAIADFYDFETNTIYQVEAPQFSVSGSASLTLDARDADAKVTIATPRPAVPAITEIGFGRSDANGLTATFSFLADGTAKLQVQPTTGRITIGQLYYYVYSRQFAANGSYSYDLKFPSTGAIPADEDYVTRPSDLAAFDSTYPAAHRDNQSLDVRFGALPWQLFLFGSDVQFTTPVRRTEYYTALPELSWEGVYYQVFKPDTFDFLGLLQSAWRTYTPGQQQAVTWGGSPAIPRLLEAPIYPGITACPACIHGSRVYLLGFPFSDNSPEHFGYPDGGSIDGLDESTHYAVYGDDVPVSDGEFLDTSVRMPSASQVLRLDYDTTRSSADFTLSTDVQTRWTEPLSVATSPLPDGWVCSLDEDVPACGILPLITASYQLPVNLVGALSPGAVTARVALAHVGGSSLAFRTVQAKVSFDGGQNWRPVTVDSQGSGNYALRYTVPTATDGYGALQLTVRDVNGGTFQQTIQHAFAVAAS